VVAGIGAESVSPVFGGSDGEVGETGSVCAGGEGSVSVGWIRLRGVGCHYQPVFIVMRRNCIGGILCEAIITDEVDEPVDCGDFVF
jgi:hypothetical protein